MQPGAIVEGLNVIEGEEPSLRTCVEAVMVEPFCLERVEKALGDRVVETVTRPAHAADHSIAVEEILVVGAEVGPAPIRVKDEAGQRSSIAEGVLKRLDRELLSLLRSGSPANDPSRVEIENHRQEEPSFLRAHLRDVGDPDSVGGAGNEIPLQSVGRGGVSSRLVEMNWNRFFVHGACQ